MLVLTSIIKEGCLWWKDTLTMTLWFGLDVQHLTDDFLSSTNGLRSSLTHSPTLTHTHPLSPKLTHSHPNSPALTLTPPHTWYDIRSKHYPLWNAHKHTMMHGKWTKLVSIPEFRTGSRRNDISSSRQEEISSNPSMLCSFAFVFVQSLLIWWGEADG